MNRPESVTAPKWEWIKLYSIAGLWGAVFGAGFGLALLLVAAIHNGDIKFPEDNRSGALCFGSQKECDEFIERARHEDGQ